MLYYSIVPGEEIFAEEESELEFKEIEVAGTKLLLRLTGERKGKIAKVISSNPQDYLDSPYQPGTEVELSLELKN